MQLPLTLHPSPWTPIPNPSTLQGHRTHEKHPPPWDHHKSLGIGLLQGPTGGVFHMSELPVYTLTNDAAAASRICRTSVARSV